MYEVRFSSSSPSIVVMPNSHQSDIVWHHVYLARSTFQLLVANLFDCNFRGLRIVLPILGE